MMDGAFDPSSELATIRSLMERAREYRHPPAPVGVVAGTLGVAAGALTHRSLQAGAPDLTQLSAVWGGVFLVALATTVFFTWRTTRSEGIAFWSPLARDVVHALWPPLVGALALSVPLARAGRLDLVAPLWLLAYGAGGIAAGAFASPIVRWLGAAFLAAGLAVLVLEPPPGLEAVMADKRRPDDRPLLTPADLDPVIHERVRLSICSTLAARRTVDYLELRTLLGLTDGNLAGHLRVLEKAGYVAFEKSFVERKTRTSYKLTAAGRRAFEKYVSVLAARLPKR